MISFTHTPAPWTRDERGILRGSNGRRVGDLDNGEPITIDRHAEVTGDRALQEAAPELLKAMKAASGYLLNAAISLGAGSTKRDAIRIIEDGLRIVNAAIAKATGGEAAR